MGVTISKGSTFLGVPLIKVRNLLKAWHHGNRSNTWRIAELKAVDLDPRTAMVLLEELRDRGLLGLEEVEGRPPEDGLTEAGLALAGAGARKRTPKAAAQRILDRFLDACAAVNARSDLPFEIREVWLFGSMLDPAVEEVGDIDLVVQQGRTAAFEEGDSARERYRQLGKEMGAPETRKWMGMFGDQEFVERQLLHGGHRHPFLSMNRVDELRDMACPCRLAFDASRGGRVDDPILHRHPASKGRSNRIGDKRRMPDLAEGRQPLKPLPASLMTNCDLGWRARTAMAPWPADDWRHQSVSNLVSKISPVADGIKQKHFEPNAMLRRIRFESCDGRERAGLLLIKTKTINPGDWRSGYRSRPMVAAVLARSIRENGRAVRYDLDFSEADHLGRGIEYEHILAFEWWINVIATADIERILRREQELGLELDISAGITFSADRSIADALAETRREAGRCLVAETRSRIARQAGEGFREANSRLT